jgi:hypothetical protein
VTLADKVRNRFARARQHRWRMAPYRSTARHVVIGGSPRSGTTLLRRTFDRHPGLCCGPETNLLLPVRVAFGPLAAGSGIPEAELRAMFDASGSQGAFVDSVAARYQALRGRPRWAEKTPQNIRHLEWILSRWPEARVIHVLRDGRDVVCSMRDHPDRRWVDGRWVKEARTRPIEELARRWVADTAAGMAWRGDPRYLEVRYEELVSDPPAVLDRVLAFLGERSEPGLLSTGIDDGGGRPDAAGAITTSSVERWRRDLSPAEQAIVRRVAGARLGELGYATGDAW